jgi:hypothetical protein
VGRRKQKGSRESAPAKPRAAAKDRPSPAAHSALPPAKPPRRNVPLLVFSIALFLLWLAVLIVLANFQ